MPDRKGLPPQKSNVAEIQGWERGWMVRPDPDAQKWGKKRGISEDPRRAGCRGCCHPQPQLRDGAWRKEGAGTRAVREEHRKSWQQLSYVLLGFLPNRTHSSRRILPCLAGSVRERAGTAPRVCAAGSRRDREQMRQHQAFKASQGFFASKVRHG